MSVRERDPLTGHSTTGHEWNGITELNTRVPRAIWIAIIVTHVWALVVWILMPAWPLVWTYTGGLLGIDQKEAIEETMREAQAERAGWAEPIAAMSVGRDPGGSRADAGGGRHGAGAVRRQLRALPRAGRRRRTGLPEPRRRRPGSGAATPTP